MPVAEITLPETLILTMGIKESETLTASILPENATCKNITWASSDESVATVDDNGKVTAIALGVAMIIVYAADGSPSSQCEVSVNQLAQSITLDKASLELHVGDEPILLTATVLPENNTIKSFEWSSSDTSVAVVDESGSVTAVSKGSATITAATIDGSMLSASCSVSVSRNAKVSTLSAEGVYCCQATINGTLSLQGVSVIDRTDISVGFVVGQNDNLDNEGTLVLSVLNDDGSFRYHLPDLQPNTKYFYRAIATVDFMDYRGDVHGFTTLSSPVGVDMGCYVTLEDNSQHNILWAEWNVGATTLTEYGGYYSWGEVETKTDYSWANYKWTDDTSVNPKTVKKYCREDHLTSWGGTGAPDGKRILDLEDDAAHYNWGDNWRMPTDPEWVALKNQCSWEWTTMNGVKGCLCTSNTTGNTLFFPAAGCYWCNSNSGGKVSFSSGRGNYWSSSLYCEQNYSYDAWMVELYTSVLVHFYYPMRSYGQSVRAVIE